MDENTCPQCHQPIQPDWYFCQNCGKELKAKPRSTTVLAQVGIYALSVFLPPLGLWPGIKYVREADPKAEQCGWCKDRFGLSWQVVPQNMSDLMQRPDAYAHMMQMKKIIINDF